MVNALDRMPGMVVPSDYFINQYLSIAVNDWSCYASLARLAKETNCVRRRVKRGKPSPIDVPRLWITVTPTETETEIGIETETDEGTTGGETIVTIIIGGQIHDVMKAEENRGTAIGGRILEGKK